MTTKKHVETLTEFQGKIDRAKIEGEEWVETTPEIIKYYNRQGLGPSEYFQYGGIKVCEIGQSERISALLDVELGQINHGPQEAKVNQPQARDAKSKAYAGMT